MSTVCWKSKSPVASLDKKLPKVVIAEDDPGIRLTIELVLQEEDLDIHFASDGIEALDLARKVQPQLMVVDQMMPKMDGKTVVTELQRDEATRKIPVVILSGMAQGEDEDWHGAEFLGKPFSPDELVDRIRLSLKPT